MNQNLRCLFSGLLAMGLVLFPACAGGMKEAPSPEKAADSPETIAVSVFWIQEATAEQSQKMTARNRAEGDIGLYHGFAYRKSGDTFQWTGQSSLTVVGLRTRNLDSGNPDWVLTELYGTARTTALSTGGKKLVVMVSMADFIAEARKGGGAGISRVLPSALRKVLKDGKGTVSLVSCVWNPSAARLEATCLVTD